MKKVTITIEYDESVCPFAPHDNLEIWEILGDLAEKAMSDLFVDGMCVRNSAGEVCGKVEIK